MPSNRCLNSPPGRTGGLARGSYNFRKRSLRRSRCEHGGVGFVIIPFFWPPPYHSFFGASLAQPFQLGCTANFERFWPILGTKNSRIPCVLVL